MSSNPSIKCTEIPPLLRKNCTKREMLYKTLELGFCKLAQLRSFDRPRLVFIPYLGGEGGDRSKPELRVDRWRILADLVDVSPEALYKMGQFLGRIPVIRITGMLKFDPILTARPAPGFSIALRLVQ